MKHLALVFFTIFSFSSMAQTVNVSGIEKLREGKLIAALTGNEEVDNAFKDALSTFWDITEIEEFLPYKDAKEKAKNDKSTYLIYITSGSSIGPSRSASSSNASYRYISKSKRVKISSGKKNSNPILYCYFPSSSDGRATKESLFFAVANIQYTAETMLNDGIKSTLKWNKIYNKFNQELKDLTIYLFEGWVESGLTSERVQEIYPASIKVVTFDEWSEVVLTRKEGAAYCLIAPIPQAGKYTYVHYFMKSGEAKVLGTSYSLVNPTFKGPEMSVGGVNFIGEDIDLSKVNSGYITEQNVKKYTKMIAD